MRSATSATASAPLEANRDPWHALPAVGVLARLQTQSQGLSTDEAARRLKLHGPNSLPVAPRTPAWKRFAQQFRNVLIHVLLISGGVSAALGHPTDALVILAVVLLNALIGFVQEGKAEQALDAIRSMIDPQATVLRNGHRASIAAEAVVRGDIVLLEAGDRVPADLRLLRARNLRIDEAALTGESVPVDKQSDAVDALAELGDRSCMAYSGTLVASGQGVGVVVQTGVGTELGRISRMLGSVDRLTTPLVRQMDRFAQQVTWTVLVASALVFAYAAWSHAYPLDEAFMSVVGLAVAAIPEGLPAVMTITLALGVQRMARRHAIVRRLPAVETLGSVSVICSDKTGTLTRNEMQVRRVVLGDDSIDIEGAGYAPTGGFSRDAIALDPAADPLLEELALACVLCNDATLRQTEDRWTVNGDPMEGALVCLAMKAGHDVEAARTRYARRDEIPFDARHRYMASLHERPGGMPVIYVKGAPERVLAMCSTVQSRAYMNTGMGADVSPVAARQPLEAAQRRIWQQRIEALAADGQRVLALARRDWPDASRPIGAADVEQGLVLLGLVGLIDPPRPEAVEAIAECRAAGIQVKMITGDHATTARAIARQLGLAQDPLTLTGQDLAAMDPATLREQARHATVFARTSPENKLQLVEALQADGSVIAMTGDGVNDAPALKRADVGVAMGGKGTEAAKEAAEIVLADDNFASIVAAVREGRTVYDNVGKVITWTLPTNGGEAFTIILAMLFGLALPVTPVQILWINMVTAVALGLTLAFEPTEAGVMRRPPRPAGEGLLSARLVWRIVFVSVLMVIGTFGLYHWTLQRGLGIEIARTAVVNALVTMEIFYLFSVRYVHGSSLTLRGVLGTPAVLIGVATVAVAQLAFTYLPAFHSAFGSRALGPSEALVVLATGWILLLVVETEKRVARRWFDADRPLPSS